MQLLSCANLFAIIFFRGKRLTIATWCEEGGWLGLLITAAKNRVSSSGSITAGFLRSVKKTKLQMPLNIGSFLARKNNHEM
jgi:hypothetical protein